MRGLLVVLLGTIACGPATTGVLDGASRGAPDGAVDAASAGDQDSGIANPAVDAAEPDAPSVEPDALPAELDGAQALDAAIRPDATVGADAQLSSDGGQASAKGRYDQDGPETVLEATLSVDTGSRSFSEHLYIPGSPGPHPVVSLSPGLQQHSAAYIPYLRRLASFGLVAISHDDFGALTATPVCTSALGYLLGTWLPAQNADSSSPLFGKLDLTRIGLAGHSRGGKASLIAAEMAGAPGVGAWFGIDPIDSSILADGVSARDGVGALHIPLTFLGATVSGACSPAADNYTVLYGNAGSPSVEIVAQNAGHVQFEDPAACTLCSLCNPAGTADSATVLAFAVRYLTAFFARELLHDATVGAAFEGAGGPIDQSAGLVVINQK